jgi:hypothetical protein
LDDFFQQIHAGGAGFNPSPARSARADVAIPRQGDYPRERFVAKSGMKRFFHRQDAKFAKPN